MKNRETFHDLCFTVRKTPYCPKAQKRKMVDGCRDNKDENLYKNNTEPPCELFGYWPILSSPLKKS